MHPTADRKYDEAALGVGGVLSRNTSWFIELLSRL
jgi:hypothetical protein